MTLLSSSSHSLCCLLLIVIVFIKINHAYQSPFGLQTGVYNKDNAKQSTYAVSMLYNDHNNEITVTGGTYGSYFRPAAEKQNNNEDDKNVDPTTVSTMQPDCFVAVLRLPHQNANGVMTDPNKVSWVRRRQYGTETASEFCSDLISSAGGKEVITIGYATEKGILSSMLPYGSFHRQVYGMILDLDSAVDVKGGNLFHSDNVQFPMKITTDPVTEDIIIAELFSELTVPLSIADSLYGEDLSATGYHLPWNEAKGYSIRLKRMTRRKNSTTTEDSQAQKQAFTHSWIREFGTMGLEDVRVSALHYVNSSRLVMAGYTSGGSDAFGMSNTKTIESIDSFLTVIDPATGNIVDVLRIESSLEAGNDRIMGLCYQEDKNLISPPSEIFLVGTTEIPEKNSSYAFLHKVDLDSLKIEWSRRFEGKVVNSHLLGPQIHGMACAVTNDGNEVYMAGNVLAGTILPTDDPTETVENESGDIFVAKFDSIDGALAFSKQVGSRQRDSLAHGKSLATDLNGNLIVTGNTEGSVYRQKIPDGSSDIIFFSIGRENGNYLLPHASSEKGNQNKTRSHARPTSQNQARPWVVATYILVITLMITAGVYGILHARKQRKRLETLNCNKGKTMVGIHCEDRRMEGIWRTATLDTDSDNDSFLGRFCRKEAVMLLRGTSVTNPPFVSSMNMSSSRLPRATYRDENDDSTEHDDVYGEIYDLLSEASKRFSRNKNNSSASSTTIRTKRQYEPDLDEGDLSLDLQGLGLDAL